MEANIVFSVNNITLPNRWKSSDSKQNIVEKHNYFVYNRSVCSQQIRVSMSKTSNSVFSIVKGMDERCLAAGLSMPVVLMYAPNEYCEHTGEIEVFVGEKLTNTVPVKGVLPISCLVISTSELDFDVQVDEYHVASKSLIITNSGDLKGSFCLQEDTIPPYLSVLPSSGVIEPKQSLYIVVELLCNQVREVDDNIRFTLDNEKSLSVHIRCTIMKRALEVFDLQGEEVDKLTFNSVYYGSTCSKKLLLLNSSPIPTDFTAQIDEDMSECANMSKGLAMAITKFESRQNIRESEPSMHSVFSVVPEKGKLAPYEKCEMNFWYTPKNCAVLRGWSHFDERDTQRDYSVKFQILIKNILSSRSEIERSTSITLSASARPVCVKVTQGSVIDFGSCVIGGDVPKDVELTNYSSALPIRYECQTLAHYRTHPSCGIIMNESSNTIRVSFLPKQLGFHNFHLYIHFWGPDVKVFRKSAAIHTVKIELKGNCIFSSDGCPKKSQKLTIASPNDLACSIRPWTHNNNIPVISPYAKLPRYSYRDPDYSYSMEEAKAILDHKNLYSVFLSKAYSDRVWRNKEKLEFLKSQNSTNLGISPNQGMQSPIPRRSGKMLTHGLNFNAVKYKVKKCEEIVHDNATELTFYESCPTVILNNKIIEECRRTIPPDELSLIVIEPPNLNFGKVVINSSMQKDICIRNFSSFHISIKLKVHCYQMDCMTYPQRKTIFFILSPRSCTNVMFLMKYSKLGNIEGNLGFTINEHHMHNCPVFAVVNDLNLELSSTSIVLSEQNCATVDTGFWGSVELKNNYDVPLFFKWVPRNKTCSSFFALQLSGQIEGSTSMMSGFVYLPSFDSPSSSEYFLQVGSDTRDESFKTCATLSLNAKFQKPQCNMQHRRLLYGVIPINIVSSLSTTIENKSEFQAFFKVTELASTLNLQVFPSSGCIPGGGALELKLDVCPSVVGAFDVKLCVCIRESKQLLVRLSGTVEQPSITVEKEILHFGGVVCGTTACIPYTITNMGSCKADLTFNFSNLHDFLLVYPQESDGQNEENVVYLSIPSKSSIACSLEFKPREIAAYDFFLSVLVNGLKSPSPPASPWPPSNTYSSIITSNDLHVPYDNTPTRRVIATVLKSPLQIVCPRIHFLLPPISAQPVKPVVHDKLFSVKNLSTEPITWALDFHDQFEKNFRFIHPTSTETVIPPSHSNPGILEPGDSYQLKTMCTLTQHGSVTCSIPILINGMPSPYGDLTLSATLPTGSLAVSPSHIIVHPIPLGVATESEFHIMLDGFSGNVDLDVSLPVVEDFMKLIVNFPTTHEICDNESYKSEVLCTIKFSSIKAVSKTDFLTITEKRSGIRMKAPVTLSADNSLFSLYEFLSLHLESTVIKENEYGIPCLQLQRHSAGLKVAQVSNCSSLSVSSSAISSVGVNYEQMYQQDCVAAVCRWLSAYSGPGIKLLSFPTDFCLKASKDTVISQHKHRSRVSTSKGMLIDMLTHLCGRLPPGIPLNFPQCFNRTEKIFQLYSTYDVVLKFLRNQGAILSSITPEVLLDYGDYLEWIKTKKTLLPTQNEAEFQSLSIHGWTCVLMQIIKAHFLPFRAFCFALFMIIQVLLFVHPQIFVTHTYLLKKAIKPNEHCCLGSGSSSFAEKKEKEAKIEKSFTSDSNIYSTSEMKLLVWLNQHYNDNKKQMYGTHGSLTSVVNFDVDLMDSVVLCCVLYSYCPFLKDSHFSKLFCEPSSQEQCAHNAIVFLNALQYIGINYNIQQNDICSPNPIFMILFCAHLYSVLPTYKPTNTIEFSAPLTKSDEAKIEVKNNHSKDVNYLVLIRGDNVKDFSTTSDISVPHHGLSELTITYHCCSLLTSYAFVYLFPTGKQSSASVLSFALVGSSTGAVPKIVKKITTSLFEQKNAIFHISGGTGTYKVQLYESNLLHIDSKHGRSVLSKAPAFIPCSDLQRRSEDRLNFFHCVESVVTLKSDVSTAIFIQFIPLKQVHRHCSVVLSNSKVGDIVLSVVASVNQPQPTLPEVVHPGLTTVVNKDSRTLHFNTTTNSAVKESIVIHNSNPALEKALLEICKWGLCEDNSKKYMQEESLRHAALACGISKLHISNCLNVCSNNKFEEAVVFSVNGSDNKHFIFPEQINVPTAITGILTGLTVTVNVLVVSGSVLLPIHFYADEEGQYECHLHLKSGYDIRTIIVEATVTSEKRVTEIEFKTQAIQSLTQNIPVVNPSTSDWSLTATISTPEFSGPSLFFAQALSTSCYPLTFNPHVEGVVYGELKLNNREDYSEHLFKLVGVAERPLAQERIKIMAQVRQKLTHVVHIPNLKDKTTVFRVESDLDFISGPSEISIGGNDIFDYPLTILPKDHGTFTGTLMFIAKSAKLHKSDSTYAKKSSKESPYHLWFQIDCEVDYGPPDFSTSISCPTFCTRRVDLCVDNPTDEMLKLAVIINGEYLSGPKEIVLEPSQKSICTITFSPLSVGKFNGRVMFKGFSEGEFWYQLDLKALNPEIVKFSQMNCEVGRNCSQAIRLRNPLAIPVRFTCNNSNTEHYTVTGLADGSIVVSSHSEADIPVLFYPSSIGTEGHSLDLAFISHEFGTQVFSLRGKGLLPSSMDPITINSGINSAAVHTISFVNPLHFPIHLSVILSGKDSKCFFLLNKKYTRTHLRQGGSLDIPIMFAPERMCTHEAAITIVTHGKLHSDTQDEKNLHWEYPIYGQPELRLLKKSQAPKLTCRAKQQLRQIVEITLVKSLENSTENCFRRPDSLSEIEICETKGYCYELKSSDANTSSLVKKSTALQLLGREADPTKQTESDVVLVFEIKFTPSKAFCSVCDFTVSDDSGCLWVLPMNLHALSAHPDDVITIESRGLNKETHLGFRLSSPTEAPMPFTALIGSGSDPEITVSPMSGVLAPCTSKGTLFVVKYRPTMYGKNHCAKFVVQCDTTEWCYKIIGKLPKYSMQSHQLSIPLNSNIETVK